MDAKVFKLTAYIYALFCFFLFYILIWSEKLNNNSELITSIATIVIALFTIAAVYISHLLYEIHKGQTRLEMNKAFNDLNQLVLANKVIRNFTKKFVYTRCSYQSCKCDCSVIRDSDADVLEKSFIISILNIYEAYYLSNPSNFSKNIPLVLRNMGSHSRVRKIVEEFDFSPSFKHFFDKNFSPKKRNPVCNMGFLKLFIDK